MGLEPTAPRPFAPTPALLIPSPTPPSSPIATSQDDMIVGKRLVLEVVASGLTGNSEIARRRTTGCLEAMVDDERLEDHERSR